MMDLAIKGKFLTKVINGQVIFSDMTIEFPNQSIIQIVGANGSGKSVTLKMLAQIYKPTVGNVTINGQVSYAPDHLPKSITLTVQQYLLFVEQLYEVQHSCFALDDLIQRFHIEAFLSQPIKQCSKGTQQKLNLIQCLLKQADIYILDEPFSGLDKQSVSVLTSILKYLKQYATVILTSHDEAQHYGLVTHQFKLSTQRLMKLTEQAQVSYKIIETQFVSQIDLNELVREFDMEIIEQRSTCTLIKVNQQQCNHLLKILIDKQYDITTVKEWT